MDFDIVAKFLFEKFQNQNIEFAIIGGFALHVAGYPRATNDIDFLILKEDALKVRAIMLSNSYELIQMNDNVSNYWSPIRSLGGVDFLHAHRKYALAMLKRARIHEVFSRFKVKVIIPEDIIGLKIQSSANDPQRYTRDFADIEAMIKINFSTLDINLVRDYFKLFDMEKELDQILERMKCI